MRPVYLLLLVAPLVWSSHTCLGQSNGRVLKVYDFGMWFCPSDSCRAAVMNRYGYKRVDGGCVTRQGRANHNERVWRKLDERNGTGWKERMKAELEAQCGPDPCVVY